MTYSLKQAAEATGKSKPTILRAIQSGKISASKNDHDEWQIEPAELHRVYEPIKRNGTRNSTKSDNETVRNTNALQSEIDILREQIGHIKEMSERERSTLSQQIEDLRNDRDQWREQADKWQEQAKATTRLLEDHREKDVQKAAQRPAGFWSRLLGRTA